MIHFFSVCRNPFFLLFTGVLNIVYRISFRNNYYDTCSFFSVSTAVSDFCFSHFNHGHCNLMKNFICYLSAMVLFMIKVIMQQVWEFRLNSQGKMDKALHQMCS